MSNHAQYRPEIDGLRAIAVVAVILYHGEFLFFGQDWFAGGFVGVDIFFVISGYLISRIIFSEIEVSGRFNFYNFYERRTRRILPALLLVMLVTSPFAYQFLLPDDLVDMARSQLAVLAFSSNIYFYMTSTDYGAAPGLLMPFLHTWSLGVEEQFYLTFPAIALLIHRYTPERFFVLAALLIASLSACFLINDSNQSFAFFIPFTRAWEMLAGSLLAALELRQGRQIRSFSTDAISLVGLLMVLISIVTFDEGTAHPGALTLIPVFGTVLLLGASSQNGIVTRVLSHIPIRYIGALSYSLYLWHYPIFALQRTVDYDFTNSDKAFGVGLAVLLSIASFHLVEQPFRRRNTWIWRPAGFGIAVTAVITGVTIVNSGFAYRLDRVLPPLALKREQLAVASFTNFVGTPDSGKPVIIIIGDSYTRNWSVALNTFIDHDRFDVVAVSYLGCDVNISEERITAVAISSKYERNCKPLDRYINDKNLLGSTKAIFLTSHRPFEYAANTFRFDLLSWIKQRAEGADLFIFGNYFQLDGTPGRASCTDLMFHHQSDAELCMDLSTYPPDDFVVERLPLYPADLDFTYVDMIDLLCGSVKANCPSEADGMPFIRDWNHLTVTFLIQMLSEIFAREHTRLQKLGLTQFMTEQEISDHKTPVLANP